MFGFLPESIGSISYDVHLVLYIHLMHTIILYLKIIFNNSPIAR